MGNRGTHASPANTRIISTPESTEGEAPRLVYCCRGKPKRVDRIASYRPCDPAAAQPCLVTLSHTDHVLEVWDAKEGRKVRSFWHQANASYMVTYTVPSGGQPRIASVDYDRLMRHWNAETGEILRVLEVHAASLVRCLYLYHEPIDGRPRLVTGTNSGAVTIYDGESGEIMHRIQGLENGRNHVSQTRITALSAYTLLEGQRQRLVVGTGSGRLLVFEPEAVGCPLVDELVGPNSCITAVECFEPSWAPEHTLIVSARHNGNISVHDGETGVCARSVEFDQVALKLLAVCRDHPEGRDPIAAAGNFGVIDVFDSETGQSLRLEGHTMSVECLQAYNAADGQCRLVSGSIDSTIKVWDPKLGHLLHSLEAPAGCSVMCLHILDSADGRTLLASGHVSGDLLIWDLGGAPPAFGVGNLRAATKVG
jgi:WD40 repeat protein